MRKNRLILILLVSSWLFSLTFTASLVAPLYNSIGLAINDERARHTIFESRVEMSEPGLPYDAIPGREVVPPYTADYVEDFTTTTYQDTINTNAVGWGNGVVRLPNRTLEIVGSYATPSVALDVFVSGDYAYLVTYNELLAVDISDPTTPLLVGSTTDVRGAMSIFVQGDYAYLGGGGASLVVVNVTDPTNMHPVGNCTAPIQRALNPQVSGNYVYFSTGSNRFFVVDVQDPSNPTLAGECYVGSNGKTAIAGDYAYIIGVNLEVVSIRDPTNPIHVGRCTFPEVGRGISIQGDYAFIPSLSSSRTAPLHVFSLQDPSNPSMVATCPEYVGVSGIVVAGNFAYIANTSSGITLVNVTNPLQPEVLSALDTPGQAFEIFVDGNHAFVADYDSGLQIIEIQDRLTPYKTGACITPDEALGLSISGDYAFLANRFAGLQVVNIQDPTNPTIAGDNPLADHANDLWIDGDFAYVADSSNGIRVFDISDPTNPQLRSECDTPSNAWEVMVDGDYAYVADHLSGLQVIDIRSTPIMRLVGSCNTPGLAYGLYVDGDYVYVADYDRGLQVIDIRIPTSPIRVASCDTIGHAYGVQVAGNYAYVADMSAGLAVIDIQDPLNPSVVGYYNPPGAVFDVDVAGNFVYLAAESYGMEVVDIHDPTNPVFVDDCSLSGGAYGIIAEGEYAFITARGFGLQVARIASNRGRGGYNSHAVAQSLELPVGPSSKILVNATLNSTDAIPANTSIEYYLSADNGLSWEQVTPGIDHTFLWGGNHLKWKVELANDDYQNTPQIELLSITYRWLFPAPRLTSPPNGSGTHNSTPTFVWQYVYGVNVYCIHLDTVPSFDSPNFHSVLVGDEKYTPTSPLSDSTWYWRVAVFDLGGELGFFSVTYALIIDSTRLAAPVLLTPQDEALINNNTTTFKWDAVGGAVSYFFELDTVASFDSPNLITASPSVANYTSISALSDDVWFWRVTGKDITEKFGWPSQIWSFSLETVAPTWDELPTSSVVEFGDAFVYDLNASDPAGISRWWLNDTTHFMIDETGIVTNATPLPVNTYGLQVCVNDSYNNILTATFAVTVQDTTLPVWDHALTDQIIEYGSLFFYDVNASDIAGIVSYWINDTTFFAIDENGQITNLTSLAVGNYSLKVRAYDPSDNYCEAIFLVTVEDTTAPTWDEVPVNQVLELGDPFSYNLNASDLSEIHYWVNDTLHFSISSSGLLTNNTWLAVGHYWLRIEAHDPYDHNCFAVVRISVQDTSEPQWKQLPTNQIVGFREFFRYNLNATDYSGIDKWLINDTLHFAIDNSGVITNITTLSLGDYGIQVWVNDTLGYTITASFTVAVKDLVNPSVFISNPYDGETINGIIAISVGVSDEETGINRVEFYINDVLLGIDYSYPYFYQWDPTSLNDGEYLVRVVAFDNAGNSASDEVTVIVSNTTTSPPPVIPGFPMEAIALGVFASLGVGLLVRRLRRK